MKMVSDLLNIFSRTPLITMHSFHSGEFRCVPNCNKIWLIEPGAVFENCWYWNPKIRTNFSLSGRCSVPKQMHKMSWTLRKSFSCRSL